MPSQNFPTPINATRTSLLASGFFKMDAAQESGGDPDFMQIDANGFYNFTVQNLDFSGLDQIVIFTGMYEDNLGINSFFGNGVEILLGANPWEVGLNGNPAQIDDGLIPPLPNNIVYARVPWIVNFRAIAAETPKIITTVVNNNINNVFTPMTAITPFNIGGSTVIGEEKYSDINGLIGNGLFGAPQITDLNFLFPTTDLFFRITKSTIGAATTLTQNYAIYGVNTNA